MWESVLCVEFDVRHSLRWDEVQPVATPLKAQLRNVNERFKILQEYDKQIPHHYSLLLIHYNDNINTTSQ